MNLSLEVILKFAFQGLFKSFTKKFTVNPPRIKIPQDIYGEFTIIFSPNQPLKVPIMGKIPHFSQHCLCRTRRRTTAAAESKERYNFVAMTDTLSPNLALSMPMETRRNVEKENEVRLMQVALRKGHVASMVILRISQSKVNILPKIR